MTTGTGIAIAAWFLAFVWGTTVSSNSAAGVVIFGLIIAAFRMGFGDYLVEEFERNRRRHEHSDNPPPPPSSP